MRTWTKKRSATQIAEELDFLGAKLSAGGADDYAKVSLTVLKKDLVAGLDLFQDVLLNPAFDQKEIQRQVAELQASFKSDEDEPGIVASRAFHRELFGAHPYCHPPKGTPTGLKAISRTDLAEFYRAHYRPNNAIFSIVGDLSQAEAAQAVAKVLGGWASAPLQELKVSSPPPLNKSEGQGSLSVPGKMFPVR